MNVFELITSPQQNTTLHNLVNILRYHCMPKYLIYSCIYWSMHEKTLSYFSATFLNHPRRVVIDGRWQKSTSQCMCCFHYLPCCLFLQKTKGMLCLEQMAMLSYKYCDSNSTDMTVFRLSLNFGWLCYVLNAKFLYSWNITHHIRLEVLLCMKISGSNLTPSNYAFLSKMSLTVSDIIPSPGLLINIC